MHPKHNQQGQGHSMTLKVWGVRFNNFFKKNVQQTDFTHNDKCVIIKWKFMSYNVIKKMT